MLNARVLNGLGLAYWKSGITKRAADAKSEPAEYEVDDPVDSEDKASEAAQERQIAEDTAKFERRDALKRYGVMAGGAAAGAGLGGLLGYYLAPKKQRRLAAALAALAGAGIGGAGAHYGREYLAARGDKAIPLEAPKAAKAAKA